MSVPSTQRPALGPAIRPNQSPQGFLQAWLATSSDLGGSLRIPAAFCGVVGMRPSPGVLAPHGPRSHPAAAWRGPGRAYGAQRGRPGADAGRDDRAACAVGPVESMLSLSS